MRVQNFQKFHAKKILPTFYSLGTVGFTPVILALRRLRQGDYDFETLSKEKEYQV
jgi:hypothetical protein